MIDSLNLRSYYGVVIELSCPIELSKSEPVRANYEYIWNESPTTAYIENIDETGKV